MSFRKAVEQCAAPVSGAYRVGKSAMAPGHAAAVQCADTRRFVGSADLDEALRGHPDHAQASRWDYAVGVRVGGRERALWIEVHPASDSDVAGMIAKLSWLKAQLQGTLRPLLAITPSEFEDLSPFVWIASGRVAITPNSPAGRRLSASGLRGPIRMLRIANGA